MMGKCKEQGSGRGSYLGEVEGLVGLDGGGEEGVMFWVEIGESVGQDELKR